MEPNILIFGGAGALGTVLVRRLLEENEKRHNPTSTVTVFSRDEAKHHKLQNALGHLQHMVSCVIGDIREYSSVVDVIHKTQPTHIINCAALKQVPLCEEFILEAVKTNVLGTEHITRAMRYYARNACLVTISTDKAVQPINAYGFTKALQEKLTLKGAKTSCVVRYGNVLESTGSVIPFFKSLLAKRKALPVTDRRMTRFLLSLDDAVNLIFIAMRSAREHNKSVLVPSLKAARIQDLAEVLCESEGLDPERMITDSSIRPGEKLHETLIASHEVANVTSHKGYFTINNTKRVEIVPSETQFCSNDPSVLLNKDQLQSFLEQKGVIACSRSQSQVLRVS